MDIKQYENLYALTIAKLNRLEKVLGWAKNVQLILTV